MTDDIDNDGTKLHESGGVGLPRLLEYRKRFENHWIQTRGGNKARRELRRMEWDADRYVSPSAERHWWTWRCAIEALTAAPTAKDRSQS